MFRSCAVLLLTIITMSCAGDHADGQVSRAGTEPAASPDTIGVPTHNVAWPKGRLADTAVPLGYAIELTVIPDEDRFTGHVDIAVDLRKRAGAIYLHGRNLDVLAASVTTSDGETMTARYRELGDDGVAELVFEKEIEAQTIALEFDYSAAYGNKLHGLYRVDEDGRSYIFSQFESIYAREVFPGFDQPSYKTPFELTVNIRSNDVVIANTLVQDSTDLGDGMKRVRFKKSGPMPTYLMALAVGEFDVVQGADIPANDIRDRPVPFRGIAVHGKGAQLAHAMRTTADILLPLEEYFAMAYPYDKLDILALPDFEAGAMENIGAITFREELLLLDENASVKQRQSYTSVMAHELAHMWFGNVVTMPWWDDIWLNEAFATWMSYKAVAAFDPGQRPELRRLSRLRRAKREDALTSARQVREPVANNDGIVNAFDSITYAKGAAVLNMFESYLGEDVFREGVRAHMRRFENANADADDFIASLASVSDDSVTAAFRTFLFQQGLPRLEVDVDCEAGEVALAQARFLPRGSDGTSDMGWQLPVCMRYGVDGESHKQCEMLNDRKGRVELEHGRCPDWFMPDADFAGYYQWSMPVEGYRKLQSEGAGLSEAEWLSVGDSLEAGLASGSLTAGQAWDAMAPMATSPYPSVALAPTRLLRYLLEYFGDEAKIAAEIRLEAARLYTGKDVGRALSGRFLKGLAKDEERVFYVRLFEFMALDAADVGLRTQAYEKISEALGEKGLKDGVIPKGVLKTALTVAVQDGDAEVRERILVAFRDSRDAQFRNAALGALATTRDEAFATRLRDAILKEGVRNNEIRTFLRAHFNEPNNRPGAWRWLRANWPQLAQRMPPRHAAQLPSVAAVFCDEAMIEPVRELFATTQDQLPGGPRQLAKAVEKMRVCARRVALERDEVRARFTPGARR